MSEPTPETDAVRFYLKMRTTFEITDHEIWKNHACKLERERDEAIARSKEWSDWCVEYKSELEEAQKDTKILSRRMKVLWDSSEKVCRERDELLKECMQMSIEFGLPPTIRPADGEIRRMINGWKQAMVERDEAREDLEFRRGLYANLCEAYKVQEEYLEKAREQIKELIYIAGRAIDLAEIDYENDKFGVVSELRSDLEKIKELNHSTQHFKK